MVLRNICFWAMRKERGNLMVAMIILGILLYIPAAVIWEVVSQYK